MFCFLVSALPSFCFLLSPLLFAVLASPACIICFPSLLFAALFFSFSSFCPCFFFPSFVVLSSCLFPFPCFVVVVFLVVVSVLLCPFSSPCFFPLPCFVAPAFFFSFLHSLYSVVCIIKTFYLAASEASPFSLNKSRNKMVAIVT